MCKYCEIKEYENTTIANETKRGELIADDDVTIYIAKDGAEYFLYADCYCGYDAESFESIVYCPFCGRKLA
ncbi:hypothetical protein KW94_20145 [Clostridioides difficile]|nr:hypothetical protein KW94_20145 [Clostridioides difficile]